MKPSPTNSQELYLKSLKEIKIDPDENDIKFIEDDWKVQLWVLQVWVGKYSVTEWKLVSLLIFSRLEGLNVNLLV